MVHLSEKDRIEILMMIGYGDRVRTHEEVCHIFNDLHPERNPISRSTVTKTLQRFKATGIVKNLPKPGRPRTSTNANIKQNITIDLEESPQTSTTNLALNHDISRRSVGRILKSEKYHPYKIQLVQELSEDDFDRRLEFCERLMDICNVDEHFASNVVFSDEATFCLNGLVNRHNSRYWSSENPHWIHEAHTQHPQKLNVWMGIFENRLIGPFFIDGNLNGDKYLDLLNNQIIPALQENGQLPQNVWFQQDGAPPHYDRRVRVFLDANFPNRWIGRRGFIEWPARSPDLNPLDFFLWGYLKSRVYVRLPTCLQELRQKLIDECELIREEVLEKVTKEFVNRLAYCQEVNGEHFEHLK